MHRELADCDVAMLGSFFPEGIRAAQEIIAANKPVKVFYDIDTPITLNSLRAGGAAYLKPQQIPGFDLYLSFTAGPIWRSCSASSARRAPCRCIALSSPRTTIHAGSSGVMHAT